MKNGKIVGRDGDRVYVLMKSKDISHMGEWEVKHYWNDGVTVQCRYFHNKRDALKYLESKGI